MPPHPFARLKPQLPAGAGQALDADIRTLSSLLSQFSRITILSGAGISTESGLGDYRSPGKAKPARPPINHYEFVSQASVRRRYWARSFVGYPVLSQAAPNLAHHALAALHTNGGHNFHRHITQNVDGLLQLGGTPTGCLLELHGTIHDVVCRSCGETERRSAFQNKLIELNDTWSQELGTYEFRPDGDADLNGELVRRFRVPVCRACGEDMLIPSLVFHGGQVPGDVTEEAKKIASDSDAMLIVGSTVRPLSAYRLVRIVKEKGAFLACINFGPTRADDILDFKIEALMGDTLARFADVHLGEGFKPPKHLTQVAPDSDPLVRMLEL
ncbi:unnamed protein product [Chondrus crispus]|uniref:Deacetylase sirtuin-type domain-containing protein n=1 Tax=Chondrus crispus TaxID=2769 RepID=R7QEA8_CHOCR|nr:unnamed protein product [Chondrus crispus]CDF35765.1 unnamed protein product [Chondrus crispus]|eukprot:XP_005715584.1 unnamed protein product [Chondrus crispus]